MAKLLRGGLIHFILTRNIAFLIQTYEIL